MKKYLFFLSCLIFVSFSVYSVDTLKIEDTALSSFDILSFVSAFEDSTLNCKAEELLRDDKKFVKIKNDDVINFGLNRNDCWIKFVIKNTTNQTSHLLLSIPNPDLNYLDYYEFSGSTLINQELTGELRKKRSRKIGHRFFLFKLEIESGKVHSVIIRSNNEGDTNLVPILIQKEEDFYINDLKDQFFFAFIYGILFLTLIFNFFLYKISNDNIYIKYFGYILFFTIFLLSYDGYIYFIGWQWLSNMGKILIIAVADVFFISFAQQFLESSKKWSNLNKVLNWCKIVQVILGILPILHFSFFISISIYGITLVFLLSFIVFIIYAFKSYNKDYLPSQYFLISFIVMIVFALFYPLKELGVISYNFFTINAIRLGFIFESLILTIAVLERFRIQQEESKKAIEESHSKIEFQNKELEIINTELEKLSIVASETDNSVAIYDNNGRIEWCNEGFEKFYETNISKLIQQKTELIEEIIPFSNVKDLFKRCLEDKKAVNYEAQLKFNGKGNKWIHTTLSPYIKGNKVIAVDTDITNLKEYESDLEQAKEKAEESDRIKTIFLSNMSHEVRTPLNGILGFSELLNQDGLTSEEKERFVQIIKSNGEQLIRIIDDILDMSLIETNQLKIWNSDFGLSQLCEELVEFFEFYKTTVSRSDVELIEEFNISIESDFIYSDSSRLKQVLMNLLKNAFKFTDEGHVKFGCSTNNKNILFYVEDTGIGIEPSKIDEVFQRFRQADERTTRKYGGNGLGLTISKGIVEKMGGNIWIDPEYNLGFRICFVIPLNIAKKSTKKITNEGQKIKVIDKHFLIVEDHDFSYQFLEDLLKPFSIKISRAISGVEAVQKIKENSFDLVLMDINLPELDGMEATKEIRKFNTDIPIIAQTAYAMSTDENLILESGCNDFISKPINSKKLFEKIEMFI